MARTVNDLANFIEKLRTYKISVINKHILLLNIFIEKRALGLYISFVDLSTRRNIEQTP